MRESRDMPNILPYERMLQECLKGELRVVNAGLPQSQRPLSTLLHEKHPRVICTDSSIHLFKRKELEYLASLINIDEQEALLLPLLIQLGTSETEAVIICQTGVEEKIISKILDMTITPKQGRITIYKPQLALIRKRLKTTTQYIFSSKILR